MPEPAARRQGEHAPVLWERVARAGRGRRSGLGHDTIAAAAVAIADADGLAAVTMRRVAAEVGAGTMSLYRYVHTRDELIDLMVDRMLGEVRYAAPSATSWRATLTELAAGTRTLLLEHPWLAGAVAGRPALGPQMLRVAEQTLARLDGPGLSIDQLLDMQMTVQQFVSGYVQNELATAEAQRTSGLTEQQWRERHGPYIFGVLEQGTHPYLRRVIIDAEDYPDPDVVFARRLGYVLDGLAAGLGLDG